MLTSPVSRVLTSAPGSRLFESRLCTCRGPVIDLACTCRIPTPVTHRITTLRGAWSAGVDLNRESGARHRRRSSLSAGQDRGAGSGHLNHRRNPVTGPMCPRIKSPLLCSRIPGYYLRLCARASEDMPLTCETSYRIMTAAASLYRDIRANMEQTSNPEGLDHYGKHRHCVGQAVPAVRRKVPPEPAPAEDTMRNHRCLGGKRQRGTGRCSIAVGAGPSVYLLCTAGEPARPLGNCRPGYGIARVVRRSRGWS